MDFILELGSSLGTVRVPGIGLVYNELVQASSSDRIVQHGTSELQVPLLSDQKLDVASSIISSPSGGLSTLPSNAMTSDEDPSLESELSAPRKLWSQDSHICWHTPM
ncbi:hypothetical protein J5N97_005016 [Dioscorea zingiberensis]|uniref:Uncharacterized protein n=1 Tax=Dioscorea zingiberensis TaxID=325984 RepID=A0A9D5D7A7_9LILI|nr:hypothetical protein J5N97_005016 [Dioscorea zingiberensis]